MTLPPTEKSSPLMKLPEGEQPSDDYNVYTDFNLAYFEDKGSAALKKSRLVARDFEILAVPAGFRPPGRC